MCWKTNTQSTSCQAVHSNVTFDEVYDFAHTGVSKMKIAALILGLLGSLVLFLVGVMWADDADHINDVEQMARTYKEAVKQISQTTGKAIPEDPKAKEALEKLD